MRNRLITFFVIAVSAVAAATAAPPPADSRALVTAAAPGYLDAVAGVDADAAGVRPTCRRSSPYRSSTPRASHCRERSSRPPVQREKSSRVCSQGDGVYRSAAVRPGVWAVEAAVPGFATTAADLEVPFGASPRSATRSTSCAAAAFHRVPEAVRRLAGVLHQPTRGASSPRRLARRSVRSKNARLAAYLAAEHLAGGFATGRTSGSRRAGEPIPRAGRSMLLRRRDLQQSRWTDRGRADPGPALGSDMGGSVNLAASFREALSELAVLPPESRPRGHRLVPRGSLRARCASTGIPASRTPKSWPYGSHRPVAEPPAKQQKRGRIQAGRTVTVSALL